MRNAHGVDDVDRGLVRVTPLRSRRQVGGEGDVGASLGGELDSVQVDRFQICDAGLVRGYRAAGTVDIVAGGIGPPAGQVIAGRIHQIAVRIELEGAGAREQVFAGRFAAVHRRADGEIGRAHVGTPVTNAHLVCRLLLDN